MDNTFYLESLGILNCTEMPICNILVNLNSRKKLVIIYYDCKKNLRKYIIVLYKDIFLFKKFICLITQNIY